MFCQWCINLLDKPICDLVRCIWAALHFEHLVLRSNNADLKNFIPKRDLLKEKEAKGRLKWDRVYIKVGRNSLWQKSITCVHKYQAFSYFITQYDNGLVFNFLYVQQVLCLIDQFTKREKDEFWHIPLQIYGSVNEKYTRRDISNRMLEFKNNFTNDLGDK